MRKDLISMEDLEKNEIQEYLTMAEKVEAMPLEERVKLLPGRIMAAMFFEPSTRTRLSFESAMHRLGGSVIGFAAKDATSVAKGESFTDTIHTVESYSDILVIRHPGEGTARLAAQESYLPVINAGDGANQHPTQTLLDLYTIRKDLGKIEGLKVAFVGDLKYSRTVHSLIRALMKFNVTDFTLVAPETLRLPEYFMHSDEPGRFRFHETERIEVAIQECDVLYMTRIQRERFPDLVEYEKVKDSYVLTAEMLSEAKDHLRVLHPLPRVNEIAYDVDNTKFAGYFPQARNGVIMRQAILLKHLGVTL
ncbi:MAG TPA: aspartate carbamoyltransferase [Caldithrix abyssi]|uniref:Aspartate carbamoyltransferase n=1 Tax=Caldithrix abyssi TaxID=187145 RepID=A0A7V4U0A2_CALAY|nr:aspartate carbamoyltransferase [Caldithrix abyssi]